MSAERADGDQHATNSQYQENGCCDGSGLAAVPAAHREDGDDCHQEECQQAKADVNPQQRTARGGVAWAGAGSERAVSHREFCRADLIDAKAVGVTSGRVDKIIASRYILCDGRPGALISLGRIGDVGRNSNG